MRKPGILHINVALICEFPRMRRQLSYVSGLRLVEALNNIGFTETQFTASCGWHEI